jgi:hypothetical protein
VHYSYLFGIESELQVLLVGEDKERNILKVFLTKKALELFSALLKSHFIG